MAQARVKKVDLALGRGNKTNLGQETTYIRRRLSQAVVVAFGHRFGQMVLWPEAEGMAGGGAGRTGINSDLPGTPAFSEQPLVGGQFYNSEDSFTSVRTVYISADSLHQCGQFTAVRTV